MPSECELLSDTPMDAPVDRNQYTIGINYYFYAATILKFAYEINSELHQTLHDNRVHDAVCNQLLTMASSGRKKGD